MRVRKVMSLMVALMVSLTACASGDSGGPDATEAAEDSASDDADQASDGPPSGTLRVFSIVALDTLDPVYAQSTDQMSTLLMIYDPLINVAPDGSLVPGLAESWEFSDDATELTLTLRPGLEFQDGTPINAEAVKTNLERAMNDPESTIAGDLANVSGIENPNEQTVVITQSAPDVSLAGLLTDRVGLIVAPSSIEAGTTETQPVGSGMFRVTRFSPGTSASLESWDGYWDAEAVRVANVEVTYSDRTTAENALQGGQADLIHGAPSVQNAQRLEAAGFQIVTGPNLRFYYLHVNRTEPPLDDPRVRRALQHAVDREAGMNALSGEYGTAQTQPFPDGYIAHNPSIEGDYDYDPDRATELLEGANLADGFSFSIVTAQALSSSAQIFQGELSKVGIDMQIEITPPGQVVNDAYINRVGEGTVLNYGGRSDPSQFFSLYYGEGGLFNLAQSTPDGLGEILSEARAATDPEERAGLLQEATQMVMEDGSLVVLGSEQWMMAATPEVSGLESYLSAKLQIRGVGLTSQ